MDYAHFGEIQRDSTALLTIQLPAQFDKRFGSVILDQPFSIARFRVQYFTAIPSSISHDDLVGVALGMYMDFEWSYEWWQRFDPRCIANTPWLHVHHCSSFSNEDLPSDYLGFVAAAKGLTFDAIVQELGGGEQFDSQDPPPGYWGGLIQCQSLLCGFGICGSDAPWNNQFQLKVLDPSSGQFNTRPWPQALTLNPIGFGVYWGRNIGDFNMHPEAAPTPPPHGTPTPH